MKFDNTFDVPLPPAEAWKVLLDVPRIAPCLPGAELTETLGPDKYKGRAGVKVGPVNLFFAGEAEIIERDDEARTAKIKAKGNDTKGRGQANATVDFSLAEHAGATRVNVTTDLNMTGMVAQYGRASELMKEIAGAILTQFADNLRREIESSENDAQPAGDGAVSAQTAAGDGAGGSAGAGAASASATSGSPATSAMASGASAAMSKSPPPAAAPVSAFSILWIALKSWFGKLLGLKRD